MSTDIQAHSTEKANLTEQTRSNNDVDKHSVWSDMVFTYCKDTDSLDIYFIEVTPGVLRYSDVAACDLLISYDHLDKIAWVEMDRVSDLLHWPLTPNPIYNETYDTLNVNLVYPSPSMKYKKTEIESLEIGIDGEGKIVCLSFSNAKNNIAKQLLSNEERKIFKKNSEEYRRMIAEWRKNYDKSEVISMTDDSDLTVSE